MFLLTREREARGWSRNELARRARMAAGDVGRIEAGRLRPYDSQLKKLARALGWPIDNARRLLDAADLPGTKTAASNPSPASVP